jgi:ABC-2 type transport system permease protein
MLAIVRKELADYFNSIRFLVLFLLVLVASGLGLYAVREGIRAALEQSQAVTEGGFVFLAMFTSSFPGVSFLSYALVVAIVVPITGIVLGFDAINSERTGGTMSRMLAQPVYRDGVINGKFLAGIITMTMMVGTSLLLVVGYGLRMIGVPPTAEEIIRLFIYFVITIIYGAFWMALAILFSVLFRRAASSLLIPIVMFLIFFIWMFLVPVMLPIDNNSTLELQIRNLELRETLLRLSPSYLFDQSNVMLLTLNWKGLGAITYSDLTYMVFNPISLGQSLLEIWPHMVGLISLSAICFGISYIVFMKQEIRAT